VETSAISYRVADFLKQHPPFHAMDEADLVDLAARGRVKFHEPNEYILWQGEPHRHQVFVIQQGTVSLWDEGNGDAALRDVRGAGDMLGIERFNGAAACLHSARSSSDVLIYAFPAADFETLLVKYPSARQFVGAYGSVIADYQWAEGRRDPQAAFLHDVVASKPLHTCGAEASVGAVARELLAGAGAVAVVDGDGRARGLMTASTLLGWIADGAGDAATPVSNLSFPTAPLALPPNATVTDALLAMGGADARALAITADGTSGGTLHAVVTSRDLAAVFGDHPVFILRDIRRAATIDELRALNQRARGFALHQLTSARSVEWVAGFLHLADVAVVKRLIAMAGDEHGTACWCVCGASGRAESLTRLAPSLVLVLPDSGAHERTVAAYQRVVDLLESCDYVIAAGAPFDPAFYAAARAEWQARYEAWIRDPITQQTYRARPLFDLRPIHGTHELWQALETSVASAVDRDFVRVLANDCLASLPPLTFFQNAVVDETGEESPVFRLEHTALRPLVDVGRVFGFAAGRVFGASTLERFAMASRLLPEHQSIFREASETLRIVLWLQGRIGIGQGTDGTELPPALVGRHDRHLLKSGFQSIHRLLELTADASWLRSL
jgi:CBS domain-containing protein